MVILTDEEKSALCQRLADELPRLRKLLKITQSELGDMCGLSRITISKIENSAIKMTWIHFMSMCQVFSCKKATKEYLYEKGILEIKFLQYLQIKDENIPPEVNIKVRDELIEEYEKYLESNGEMNRA
jgi:DNA-binding XRE family transcriptional regulator